jgi:hypothetical protein
MKRQLGILASTALLLVAGCSTTHIGPPPGTIALPSDGWKPGMAMMLVGFRGPFHASMRGGVACAWIGSEDLPDLWPAGFRVHFHPTELIDPQGHVVAREGQVVSSAGGVDPGTSGQPGAPCRPNPESKRFGSQVEVLQGVSP